jgi:hypothetical protein
MTLERIINLVLDLGYEKTSIAIRESTRCVRGQGALTIWYMLTRHRHRPFRIIAQDAIP